MRFSCKLAHTFGGCTYNEWLVTTGANVKVITKESLKLLTLWKIQHTIHHSSLKVKIEIQLCRL